MVTIEFFGVPRLRAGTPKVSLDASTVATALDGLGRMIPTLAGLFVEGDRVHPAYRACLNGERFVSDLGTPLADGDVLLLLSADVGG